MSQPSVKAYSVPPMEKAAASRKKDREAAAMDITANGIPTLVSWEHLVNAWLLHLSVPLLAKPAVWSSKAERAAAREDALGLLGLHLDPLDTVLLIRSLPTLTSLYALVRMTSVDWRKKDRLDAVRDISASLVDMLWELLENA